ncbi:MAG: chaperone modulator CbpM [Verrucomicrobiota bacterium]
MNSDLPLFEPDTDATYRLDIVAELTGISSQTILRYQEQGLIRPAGDSREFGEEALHKLRRIEHLRQTCEANDSGIRLILDLMDQVEQLKAVLRARR